MPQMHPVFILGAKAAGHSIDYLRDEIRGHTDTVVEYSSDRGFFNNLADMTELLQGKTDLVFIAHSLGVVYAVHLADRFKACTLGSITFGTPYGASDGAVMLLFLLMFADSSSSTTLLLGPHALKRT
jgi:hypothetical protein